MDTKLIEYIIAIAEEKSLSKAAERLYLSQPALSQRLKKLEEELGTPLFIRGKDGLSITDAGRIYINGGHSILQIKREALKKLSSINRRNKHALRFACATSSALECIPSFHDSCPDTELVLQRCSTPTAKDDLIMGRADLGVLLTSSLQHSILEYLPLWTGELLLAVPNHHAPISQEDITTGNFEALKDEYFILTHKNSYARDTEEQALRMMGLHPHVLCEVEDNISRCYMLNKGLGNAFVPSHTLRKDNTFSTYSLNPPLTFYIVAAYPKNITLSEPMKQMIRLLLSHFDQDTA